MSRRSSNLFLNPFGKQNKLSKVSPNKYKWVETNEHYLSIFFTLI